jgi:hypothetical protein
MSAGRAFCVIVMAALAGCAAPSTVAPDAASSGSNQSATPAAPAKPFELRLADSKLRDGWTEMPVRGGGSLIVSPEAILSPSQVDNAAIGRNGDSLILNIRGGDRQTLQAVTEGHMYKPVVFLLEGKAVYMAVLGMPLNRQLSIRIGPDGITEDEAKRCLDVVRAQKR